jgi:hypothetical protein
MDDSLQSIITRINDAFFNLESFMNGSLSQYQYFDFNLEFTKLFSEVKKYQNHTAGNLDLIDRYWELMQDHCIIFDRGPIKNDDVWNNADFKKVAGDLHHLHWDRIEEFDQFQPGYEPPKSLSILDIIREYPENKKRTKSPPKKTSYVWQNEPDKELPELYSLMINNYKLIAPETTIEQFKAIFTGQPIESINPIRWIGSNRLLAYFLESLFSGQDWQSIAGNGKHFKNKRGKLLNANDLSGAKKGYIDFGKPNDYQNIDLILKAIKKH